MKSPSIVVSAAIPTAVVGGAAIAVGAAARGSHGALGAAVGAAIVLVFFAIGQVVLARVIATNPTMAMTVAMTMYLVKIGVLFGLLLALRDTAAFDTQVFAATVLACTLAWTGAEVWAYGTSKPLYVDPDDRPPFAP